jgi:hypothetical protein
MSIDLCGIVSANVSDRETGYSTRIPLLLLSFTPIFSPFPFPLHPDNTMSAYTDPPTNLLSNTLAPSSLPRAIATPLSIISIIFYLAILGPYLVYQTINYYTAGPPWKGWSLGTLLFTRGLGLLLRVTYKFGLPRADAGAWGVPIGARRKGVRVDCRKIEGLPKGEEEELRVGWVKQADVPVVDIPGFMLSPEPTNKPTTAHQESRITGSGYERANAGEKIVYYLVGGGYVSGHPLRTHLAWTTAQQLNVRVFGTFFVVSFRSALMLIHPRSCQLQEISHRRYLVSRMSP